jgi:hypothetical protein
MIQSSLSHFLNQRLNNVSVCAIDYQNPLHRIALLGIERLAKRLVAQTG